MTEAVTERYRLFNTYEDVVVEAVRSQMDKVEMCRCEKCYKDACAIVLNRMPPHYVTSQKGALLSQLPKTQLEGRDLLVQVVRALEIVANDPKHE